VKLQLTVSSGAAEILLKANAYRLAREKQTNKAARKEEQEEM
jgi:hypothetical protein